MAPMDDVIAATWADDDWAPSPDVIRLLARKTASVTLPPPPTPVDGGPVSARAGSQVSARSSELWEPQIGNSEKFGATLESTMQSPYAPSFNQTLSPGSPFAASAAAGDSVYGEAQSPLDVTQAYMEGSPAESAPPRYWDKSFSPTPFGHWSDNHDAPWQTSVYVPEAKGLYQKATPKICCCRRVFEPGADRCLRCGTRRPVPPPSLVPSQVKAMRLMDDSYTGHERAHLWAAVYEQKKYDLQCQFHEEEEEFMHKNGHFQPQLNERSIAISERQNTAPIHERIEEMRANKTEYLEMRRQQVWDAEVGVDCTFCPRLHPKSLGMSGRDRRSLYKWDMKKAVKINKRLQMQQDVETINCPFSPTLTQSSRRMAQEYSEGKGVHERLSHDAHRRHAALQAEQDVMSNLDSRAFAVVQPQSPVTPINKESAESRERRRPKSAQSARGRSSPSVSLASSRGSPQAKNMRSESTDPSSGRRSARASHPVIPNMAAVKYDGSGGTPKTKKGFGYGSPAAGEPDCPKSQRKLMKPYSSTKVERPPPPPPPRPAVTGGKNTVTYHSDHQGVIDAVNTHSGNRSD